MEFSFADQNEVAELNERLFAHVFKECLGYEIKLPFRRMLWQEAMDRYGSDKPTPVCHELIDITEHVKTAPEFLRTGKKRGSSVRGINAKGMIDMPRKIDALTEFVKGCGAKGLAYLGINRDGTYKSSLPGL